MRTFIALEIPDSLRSKVTAIIITEKKKDLPVKWVEFENLHITLKFLGEITEQTKDEITPAIADYVKELTPFTVLLSGIGCFPNPRNPRVLWIGMDREGGDRLIEIAERLDNLLAPYGIKKEDKKFHPHLTFGRTKGFCQVDNLLSQRFETEPFMANHLTFFKSTLRPEGPVYEALQKFRLSLKG